MTEEFREFHLTANEAESKRLATLFMSEGIRIRERVITEIGHNEYVIDVHADDKNSAERILWDDIGPARTFTSGGPPSPD